MPAAETWDSNPTLTGQRSPQVLNSQRQCKRSTRPSANMTNMSTNTKARARVMLRGDMLKLQACAVQVGRSHAFFLWQPGECPGAHPGRRACRRAPPASATAPSQRRRSAFHTKPASCHSQGCILARRCAKLGQGMRQDASLLGALMRRSAPAPGRCGGSGRSPGPLWRSSRTAPSGPLWWLPAQTRDTIASSDPCPPVQAAEAMAEEKQC